MTVGILLTILTLHVLICLAFSKLFKVIGTANRSVARKIKTRRALRKAEAKEAKREAEMAKLERQARIRSAAAALNVTVDELKDLLN